MYQTAPYQPSQGQGQGPAEMGGQPSQPAPTQTQLPQNGQYSGQQQPYVQNYGYQMMSFPQNMTVQSVETYQQQRYQPGTVGYQGAPPPQEGASQPQTSYTQFQPCTSVNQGSYIQQAPSSVPVYYSTPTAQNGAQGGTYPAAGGQMSVSTPGTYRPRTPPGQTMPGPSPAVGQPPTSIATTSQYVYTYPQQGPPAAGTITTQRMQAPQIVPYQGVQVQSVPPQPGYNVVRQNMQIGMQVQTRTTPPPGSAAAGSMPVIHGVQVRYPMEQVPRAKEGYPPDVGGSGDASQTQNMIPAAKVIPVPQIRTPGGTNTYRPVMHQVSGERTTSLCTTTITLLYSIKHYLLAVSCRLSSNYV